MNPTLQNPQPATLAQLFGSSYAPEYLKYLDETIQFPKPIIPRINYGAIHRLVKKRVTKYYTELEIKHPKIDGKRQKELIDKTKGETNNKKGKLLDPYNARKLWGNSAMATFFVLLEMWDGYLNAMREGKESGIFMVSPSALSSRRCFAIGKEPIRDHLWRLEQAGLIEYEWTGSKYAIRFNPEYIELCRDRIFTETIKKQIIHKAPGLQNNENFRAWTECLNPSYFAVVSGGSAKLVSMFLLDNSHNSNSLSGTFVNGGKEFSSKPPFQQEQVNSKECSSLEAITAELGAKFFKDDESVQKNIFAREIDRALQKHKKKQEIIKGKIDKACEVSTNEKKNFINNAFNLAIGILHKWWQNDIASGKITAHEIETAKGWIEQWIFGKGQPMPPREYVYNYFAPVLHNLRRAMDKTNSTFKPPLYLFFNPNHLCSDGSPAYFKKSIIKWQENEERKRSLRMQVGTKKKIKTTEERDDSLNKAIMFVMRTPSEKNYYKAKKKLGEFQNRELMHIFFHSIKKYLPVTFMQKEKRYYEQ